MKKMYIVLFICLNNFTYSQRITVSSNVDWPLGLEIMGNTLYVAEANLNRISKINISASYPTSPISYVQNLERPNHMRIKDNMMFFTEYNGNKISKIDITQSNPIAQTVVSGLVNPRNVTLIGNFLFYSEIGKISKIDITLSNPTPQIVLSGLSSPFGLVNYGNYLYYCEYSLGQINKIDLTENNPIPILVKNGLNGPNGLAIKDNILYFAEYGSSTISTLDLSQTIPNYATFDTNIKASGFVFNGNDLYVSDYINNVIYKYSINLSVDGNVKNKIVFYPNPAKNFIWFNSESPVESISIFDLNGKLIKEEKVYQNKIDISDLNQGLYLLNIINKDGVSVKKIFKE